MAEQYSGVKFRVNLIARAVDLDKRIESLKYWCYIFDKYQLAPPYSGGSYGNLSYRESLSENIFIITGTQIGMKSSLSDDKFVRVTNCDFKKQELQAEGLRLPSSESMLHFAIYNCRPDVNAIFHGHSQEILSSVPKYNWTQTAHEESYGSISLVNSVLDILSPQTEFFIIKNHGFFAIGKDMTTAGEIALKYLKLATA